MRIISKGIFTMYSLLSENITMIVNSSATSVIGLIVQVHSRQLP